ncbi:MAG: hypothetical protein JWO94_2270 [Verrucomicrobiaceae bacterium]|nr:hypothetical protein [Verrucomicrobiaceae bacterium]
MSSRTKCPTIATASWASCAIRYCLTHSVFRMIESRAAPSRSFWPQDEANISYQMVPGLPCGLIQLFYTDMPRKRAKLPQHAAAQRAMSCNPLRCKGLQTSATACATMWKTTGAAALLLWACLFRLLLTRLGISCWRRRYGAWSCWSRPSGCAWDGRSCRGAALARPRRGS